MPDIALRFNKDMLVLSSPVEPVLERQGIDVGEGLELTSILEPENVEEALRLSQVAGAQCLVANTVGITPARLAENRLEDHAAEIAKSALSIVRKFTPQHTFVEIGPCGLPLDASSKNSLKENRDQYARAARLFADLGFDAYFLNGFAVPADLQCAIQGVRDVCDMPVIASVDVDAEGLLADGRHSFEDALGVMLDCGASVAGFATPAPLERAQSFARRACGLGGAPVLAQLVVRRIDAKQDEATDENPYYCADTMVQAASALRAAGAQFLRAAGAATPAYTGALVAASEGLDVSRKLD